MSARGSNRERRPINWRSIVCFVLLCPNLIFTAFVWLVLYTPNFLLKHRRIRRRRRGLCVICKYPVGDCPACPDCGYPTGHKG